MSAPFTDAALGRWEAAGTVALAVIVLAMPLHLLQERSRAEGRSEAREEQTAFVGSAACRDCHRAAYDAWLGSDHDLAMAEATEDTVLGDFDEATFTHQGITSRFFRSDGRFFVHTEGAGGVMADHEVAYVFGHDPLQQYLVPFPGGRLQALSLAWDSVRQRWFHLYEDREIPPGDWLHWTRNAQNWNGMCAECHSTNLVKGYDPSSDTYTTTWSDIDVGCEACHGPGAEHVAWAEIEPMARGEVEGFGLVVTTRDIEPERLVELCAPCHARRSELGDYDHTGGHLLDSMVPSLLAEGLYYPDGQILDEVYVYGSFLQSKMYARSVTCSDCHDVHSLKLHRTGNALCLGCHQAEVYDSPDHHFHKKVHEGRPSDGALCVRCHAAERPYMVVDWRTDHSFRLPRPDLVAVTGAPSACSQAGCHDDRPNQWLVDAQRRWYGLARRPHYGVTLAGARQGRAEARDSVLRLARDELSPAIVRATALSLLDRYPGEASTAVLEQALLCDEALLRHTAVRALVTAEAARRAALLAPLLADQIRAVRLAAVAQLAGGPLEYLKPYQREAFDSELVDYLRALKHSLDFAASGVSLGNLMTALGRPDDAERAYRQAVNIDDLFFPARMNLAVLLSTRGRNDGAEVQLREVLEAYPDSYEAAYSLGLLLAEMGRPEEAVQWLTRAARGVPERARVQYNLGLLLQQLGRLDEAEQALGAAVALEPEQIAHLHALADHYLRRRQPRRALSLAEQIIALEPDNRLGHDLKAFAEQMIVGGR